MPRPRITHNVVGSIDGSFLPEQILDLILWLDAADEATITKDGSDNVSQWDDKSISGNNAVQVTGVSQPLFMANHINGKPAILFDGVNERMELTSDTVLASDFTMFFVQDNSAVTDTRYMLGHNVDNNKIGTLVTRAVSRIINGGSVDFTQNYPAQDVTNIYTIRRDALNKIDLAFDGAAFTRIYGDIAQVGSTNWNSIGSDNFGQDWFGHVIEVLIYDRALVPSECTNIVSYLMTKWGI